MNRSQKFQQPSTSVQYATTLSDTSTMFLMVSHSSAACTTEGFDVLEAPNAAVVTAVAARTRQSRCCSLFFVAATQVLLYFVRFRNIAGASRMRRCYAAVAADGLSLSVSCPASTASSAMIGGLVQGFSLLHSGYTQCSDAATSSGGAGSCRRRCGSFTTDVGSGCCLTQV